jgi:ribosome-associated toxin RatA of RatAB toxin-antitoxin module
MALIIARKTRLCTLFSSKRCIFSLSGSPTRHTEKRIIPLCHKSLFNVVLDVDAYNQFLPFCVHSKIIRNLSPSEFEADLAIGFQNVNGHYRSLVSFDHLENKWIKADAIDSTFFSTMNSAWVGPRHLISNSFSFISFIICPT